MIPKIIHYCWFGNSVKPKLVNKCISSWKRYAPDYQIIEWNEESIDLSIYTYAKEAYSQKKWAFVADYIRVWAIYHYGGIYLDTDVELLKPIDSFLSCSGFTGFESSDGMLTGIMGGIKGLKLYKKMLDHYDRTHFIRKDGSLDLRTNVSIATDIFTSEGFIKNNRLQMINGFVLYPSEYFCPKQITKYGPTLNVTKKTVCIHHFLGSWLPDNSKEYFKKNKRERRIEHLKKIVKKCIGKKLYAFLKTAHLNQLNKPNKTKVK